VGQFFVAEMGQFLMAGDTSAFSICERPHVLQVARGETLRFGEGGWEVGTEPVNHTRSPPLLRGQATAMHVRTMVADEEALPLQDGTDRMAEGVIKRLNDGGFGFIG